MCRRGRQIDTAAGILSLPSPARRYGRGYQPLACPGAVVRIQNHRGPAGAGLEVMRNSFWRCYDIDISCFWAAAGRGRRYWQSLRRDVNMAGSQYGCHCLDEAVANKLLNIDPSASLEPVWHSSKALISRPLPPYTNQFLLHRLIGQEFLIFNS